MKIETEVEWANEGGIDGAVIEAVARRIHEQVREQVEKIVCDRAAALIDECLGGLIEEELLKPFQRSNQYGEPQGEATSLRASDSSICRRSHANCSWPLPRAAYALQEVGARVERNPGLAQTGLSRC